MLIRASSPVDSWSPISFILLVCNFWMKQGYSYERTSVGKSLNLKQQSQRRRQWCGSVWMVSLNFARFERRGTLFVSYSIYFIIISIDMLAQMVRMLAFDAHVLGSIPGVCILFSQQFQVNPVLPILKHIPCTLNIIHLMCSCPDPTCSQWRTTMRPNQKCI